MKLINKKKIGAALILLIISELALTFYLATWRPVFWSAVEHKDFNTFVLYLGYFVIVAMSLCFIVSYQQYLTTVLSLSLRTKLTKKLLKIETDYPTAKQIKQEDGLLTPALTLSLGVGLFRNICLMAIYTYVIIQIGWVYVLLPVIYSILTTLLCYKLAYPLIKLNFGNQNAEAQFRETLNYKTYFAAYKSNFMLAIATKKLGYFQVGIGQIGVVLPYIFLSKLYFGSVISFGELMQIASAMGSLIDSMSYFINSFNDINKLSSCRKRLKIIGGIK